VLQPNDYDTKDWRSPHKDNLWSLGSENIPIKTASDPCPAGWRLPTRNELVCLTESDSEWGVLNEVNGRYFGNETPFLFLPAAGFRLCGNGTLNEEGTQENCSVNLYIYNLNFIKC